MGPSELRQAYESAHMSRETPSLHATTFVLRPMCGSSESGGISSSTSNVTIGGSSCTESILIARVVSTRVRSMRQGMTTVSDGEEVVVGGRGTVPVFVNVERIFLLFVLQLLATLSGFSSSSDSVDIDNRTT